MRSLNGRAFNAKVQVLWQRFRDVFLHQYLLRMIVTALLLVMLPCCLAFWGVFHYSHQKLMQSSESFCEQSAEMFTQLFIERLETVRRHAAQISVDSRCPDRPAYQMQKDKLLDAPLNYYSVFIKTLKHYEYIDCEWGLFYPAYDVLFSNHLKYSLDRYYEDQATPFTPEERAALNSSFMDSSSGIKLCPIYDQHGNGSLYVGVAVKMGTDMEPALFYYRFTANTFNVQSLLSPSTRNARFFLIDKEKQQMIYIADTPVLAPDILFEQLKANRESFDLNGTTHSLFVYSEMVLPYSCVMLLPYDYVNASIFQFYRNMKVVLVVMALLLLIMLCVLVYINYNPMRKTLFVMGLNSYNEWDSIQQMFCLMQDELLEQNQRILDYLLKNLLFGEPISATDATRLGLPVKNHFFCVYTMAGTLKTQERLDLTNWLKKQEIDSYITDILSQNYTVLICLTPKHTAPDDLAARFRTYFAANLSNREVPRQGKIVDDISLIHESYLSCFGDREDENDPEGEALPVPDPDERKYSSRLIALKEQVEDYLQKNISDYALSQTTVADYFGVSVYSLSRLFKNYIGIGFTDYVNGLRLETARKLLLLTDQSIKDIAESVGMPNNSYFSRLFKLRYQVSPAHFRRTLAISPTGEEAEQTAPPEQED